MTQRINLIPRERRLRMRTRARRRRWMAACAAYALFGAVAAAVAGLGGTTTDRALDADLAAARSDGDVARDIADRLGVEVAVLERTVAANRAIVERPDWSILLALLAEACGDEIALSRCATGAAAGAAGTEPAPIVVELEGLGRTQEAVTRFVLRMEDVTLFRQVKLRETRREPFLAGHATAFRLQCEIDAGGNGS